MRSERGDALLEFAIAWPLALFLIAGSVQYTVWGTEAYAARSAAAAGARAGSRADAPAGVAEEVALSALRPALVGVGAAAWCPGGGRPAPPVWVCARSAATAVEVSVGGSVPALLPLLPGGGRLPIAADMRVEREAFR